MLQPNIVEEAQNMGSDIVSLLTDDDRKSKYRGDPNPYRGHCYVASEALYHLLGGKNCPAVLLPFQMRWEDDSHWFILLGGKVIDPTSRQFEEEPDYHLAVSRMFMSPSPSKRTRAVMRRYYDAKLRGQLPSQH